MIPNPKSSLLPGVLALCMASVAFAGQPLPVNPMLVDALRPAAPKTEQLSLAALEDRLRETKAIPPATKAGLISEVEELVARFRFAHLGGDVRIESLRAPYDRLLAKMQKLAKGDPRLVRDIGVSKEPIWEALTDRVQFARLG